MVNYSEAANAKINLFLKVCGRFPNGYHRLYTLMQEVDISDEIKISIDADSENEIMVITPGRTDISNENNICYKAANLFFSTLNIENYGKVVITVNKNTPSEAGMGGGSSDAATVLKILSKHFNREVPSDMAVKIGADVPFFMYGHTAICEGVGEIVTPVKPLDNLYCLLVKPPMGVSTPACFKAIDSMDTGDFDELSYKNKLNTLFNSDITSVEKIKAGADVFTNDLEAPAVNMVPVIGELIEKIKTTDSLYTAMTGSGSVVFGIYETKKAAEAALNQLDLKGFQTYIVKTV